MAMLSCVEKPEVEIDQVPEQGTDFDFRTTTSTSIDLTFYDNTNQPIKGIKANIWSTLNGEKNALIYTTLTDSQGKASGRLDLPAHFGEVIIETAYIGVPNSIHVPVINGTIEMICKGGLISTKTIDAYKSSRSTSDGSFSINNAVESFTINYMGGYNNQGVPNYLEAERDQISSTLLEYINASLPEKQPVPEFHPSYLANGKKTTLDIEEECDVWLTFVHEGAGWRNAMAFYTYTTGTPPQSLDDIDEINVIFPNLSYSGSGGGLSSGDKVNIGRFTAGTSIGLVLLANGWDGSNSEDYEHIVFGDKNLNPEPNDDLKQHNVLLWDAENELFLVGFEDVRRDNIPFHCDQDFNDAILFVTSNPVEAINKDNVSPIDRPGTLDTDGDGINDILDEYPNDPNRAYDSYYPSSTTYGTFAFEDNWPNYGDYDFNDLVIDYQFKHILNADNQVVAMSPKFKIRAVGAGYRNGFGFTTDLLPSDITAVNGQNLSSNYITLNSNGTESGQTRATFIITGNVHDHFDTNGFVNTEDGSTYHEPSEVSIEITFQSPKTYADIGSVPYNPFLIISQNRGREVHLPGYAPTDLVDATLFGTQNDDTDVSIGQYYRSKTDLPWGIHLPESFDYPKENSDIRLGHLRFDEWAKSYGFSYMDWYRSQTGYRNTSHLYQRR
ncbi:hypothetical protein BFP71_13910 [Roseivirga misakiensis]|uniref:DUF4842 domain-containing protein n=2 Tax=Roseivirga misakiensis TaxID=1563681 RepID=A0A1E5SZM6_9BACT|nr:hypothetical protein BFP71_13910 [Roseivirga misakiensis]